VGNSPLVLFSASERGEDKIYSRIEFQLPSGSYRILTSEYAEDDRTAIICHRLLKDGQTDSRDDNRN
jgi:hypothetical protein